MDEVEGLNKLFFELSGESRLSILNELRAKNLKMQEIVRRLDLTSTEAFRQLNRLSEALLIEKRPDGTYEITQYGNLVLQLSSSLEFAFKYREYFLAHDIWRLPHPFIRRLAEVTSAELTTSMMESVAKFNKIITEAREYMWGISPEPLPKSFEETAKDFPEGVEIRFLSPQPPARLHRLENRRINDIPAIIVLNEKEAGVSLFFLGGRMDHAALFSDDPVFLNWAQELFLDSWEKSRPL